ncbi:lytic polysaccharide monooxygenase auxiliary activity family 9 protein [Microbulbifer sp. 2201CG32-9]|uniref:lytic polysaccharide monooxygenase auxiliary activity family 9 protein n=1 Tax=Microbulbifer sp. 2201CG32-9 TaxID=3232309 RepID=UPI00345C09FE
MRKHLFLSLTTLSLPAYLTLAPVEALAHGSMVVPESRVYNCYLNNPENPTDPACAAAQAVAGSQAFYDWNGINQGSANGNHRDVVPDGTLCAGGQVKFAGLDLARSDWEATPIAPKADGTFDFKFKGTAPHATRDWVFYVTRQGYIPSAPLKWSDLFEFCRLGNVPLSTDNLYILNCPLPPVTGKHIIYTTWQRSDSAEAFYTCTDVVLGDSGGGSNWTDEGALTAQTNLTANSTVTLRLFNQSGNDVESVQHTVLDGANSAADWAYAFAQSVNSQSQYARIGVLDPNNGQINPTRSASANRIYTTASQSLSHEIDIQLFDGNSNQSPRASIEASSITVEGAGTVIISAAGSSDPDGDPLSYTWNLVSGNLVSLSNDSGVSTTLNLGAPTQSQTVTVGVTVSDGSLSDSATINIRHNVPSGGGDDYDYVYPQGIGNYVVGQTIVLGTDGNRYRCRPFPHGGWCNINSPYHYAPGTGSNWQDAWIRL